MPPLLSSPVLVVGSLNLDLVVTAPRFPGPGETILGESLRTFCGGKGANQAYAAARLGANVILLGQVGADAAGETQRTHLAAAGVQTRWIDCDPGQPSGTAFIVVDAQHENRIVVVPGANGTFLPKALEAHADAFRQASLVLLQLEIPMATVETAARLARRHGARVVLDPAPAAPLTDSLLAETDYLTPNLAELAALSGHRLGPDSPDPDLIAAARGLHARGARKVLVKLGRRGAWLVDSRLIEAWPAHAVEAVDTTAAGDVFNGAFATALAAGASEREAGTFASAAAALSVTRPGAQASMPDRREVDAFLAARKAV